MDEAPWRRMVGWGDGSVNRWLGQSLISSLLGVDTGAGALLGGPRRYVNLIMG